MITWLGVIIVVIIICVWEYDSDEKNRRISRLESDARRRDWRY